MAGKTSVNKREKPRKVQKRLWNLGTERPGNGYEIFGAVIYRPAQISRKMSAPRKIVFRAKPRARFRARFGTASRFSFPRKALNGRGLMVHNVSSCFLQFAADSCS